MVFHVIWDTTGKSRIHFRSRPNAVGASNLVQHPIPAARIVIGLELMSSSKRQNYVRCCRHQSKNEVVPQCKNIQSETKRPNQKGKPNRCSRLCNDRIVVCGMKDRFSQHKRNQQWVRADSQKQFYRRSPIFCNLQVIKKWWKIVHVGVAIGVCLRVMGQVLVHPQTNNRNAIKFHPLSHGSWYRRGVVDAIVNVCPDHAPGEEPVAYCRGGAHRVVPVQLPTDHAKCETGSSNGKHSIRWLIPPRDFVVVHVQFNFSFQLFVKWRMRVWSGERTLLCCCCCCCCCCDWQ